MNIERARMSNFQKTLNEIAENIKKISKIIDDKQVDQMVDLIHKSRMVFLYGAGRSGFIGRCFAQRLMHLGINSCYIGEAITHQYTNKDTLIIISGSGETPSSVALTLKAKQIGGKIIAMTTPDSTIGKVADLVLDLKSKTKISKEKSLAPYTSLFDTAAFAVFDSLARVIMDRFGITESAIDKRHANVE